MPDDLKAAARQKVSDCSKVAEGAGRQSLFYMVDEDDLCRVFAFSEYAARQCLRNPGMIRELLESGDLERLYPTDQYQQYVARAAGQAADEDGLAVALRRLRHREMVRIAWRDLTGRADLFETMAELSALADACVQQGLDFLYPLLCSKYGQPEDASGNAQQMVVFAMGKLGGRELNFSSDIDLMFAFPEAGQTRSDHRSISNEEFFTRLVRRLIDVIGKSTPEGFVFRVDTRLRPYGGGFWTRNAAWK
ncbi:MAG: hypothetical protein R6U41_03315 [Desulfosalsimonas sp.]|uniref:hypothetical protein n=1 Tax=Desulfosalsimonas sp. TaxID=3073848 RepID=UPI0039709403